MIRFTAPCFVRVENPQERKELIEWMKVVGHALLSKRNDEASFILTYQGIFIVDIQFHPIEYYTGYDCGTNIALFKALAAMNDENDREQWFVMDGELLPPETAFRSDIHPSLYRKATSEEVISHFKNKDYDK